MMLPLRVPGMHSCWKFLSVRLRRLATEVVGRRAVIDSNLRATVVRAKPDTDIVVPDLLVALLEGMRLKLGLELLDQDLQRSRSG